VEIKGESTGLETSFKAGHVGEVKVEAEYAKPGDIGMALNNDAMAGCAPGDNDADLPGQIKG
jgi:hypothetical protein